MIITLAILAAFTLGVIVGAYWKAPFGHETREGFVCDAADVQAQRGCEWADEVSRN